MVLRHPIENRSNSRKLTNLPNTEPPKHRKQNRGASITITFTFYTFTQVREIINGLRTVLARAHQSLHYLVCKVDLISATYNTDGIPFQIAYRPFGTNCNTTQTDRP